MQTDSWEEPFPLFKKVGASYEGADLAGNPVHTEGCGALDFEPTLNVTPTTNLTDSPSGLDVTLHQPQDQKLGSRSPAPLRDATIRFPAGLTGGRGWPAGLAEPATEAQIGFLGEVTQGEEAGRLLLQGPPELSRFGQDRHGGSRIPAAAPDRRRKQSGPRRRRQSATRPLHGNLYIAKPFDNPFGSLSPSTS